MRAISEALTVVLLILVTIVAISVVSLYYIHVVNLNQFSLEQELKSQYIQAGQILSVVYYRQQDNNSYFYVENIGNIPINISKIYVNGTSVNFEICNSTNKHVHVLYPQIVYVIQIPKNTTTIIIQTTNNNLIYLEA
ncbi:MAG: hypothetical protein QXR34_08495 [Saccharolobus sp.]